MVDHGGLLALGESVAEGGRKLFRAGDAYAVAAEIVGDVGVVELREVSGLVAFGAEDGVLQRFDVTGGGVVDDEAW